MFSAGFQPFVDDVLIVLIFSKCNNENATKCVKLKKSCDHGGRRTTALASPN